MPRATQGLFQTSVFPVPQPLFSFHPWSSVSGLRLPQLLLSGPPPIPATPDARPGSSAPLFGLLPTLPTLTLASFSRHFPHNSWAAIFRTDLMVSVSSLQFLCTSRTRPALSPSVIWCPAALTAMPFTLLCHCRLEPQGLGACFPASWKTPQPFHSPRLQMGFPSTTHIFSARTISAAGLTVTIHACA